LLPSTVFQDQLNLQKFGAADSDRPAERQVHFMTVANILERDHQVFVFDREREPQSVHRRSPLLCSRKERADERAERKGAHARLETKGSQGFLLLPRQNQHLRVTTSEQSNHV
jgi:hypothetical protein